MPTVFSGLSNLDPAKRQRLVWLAGATVLILVALWTGVIRVQQQALLRRHDQIMRIQQDLNLSRQGAAQADGYRAELRQGLDQRAVAEATLPQGDLYRWIIKTMNGFLERHPRVDVTSYSPPETGDRLTLPRIPYSTANFSLAGTAFYHDFGRFLADLENSLPQLRIRRLSLDAIGARTQNLEDRERLNFVLEFSSLVRPTVVTNQ
jgi:hypothetical protein